MTNRDAASLFAIAVIVLPALPLLGLLAVAAVRRFAGRAAR